MPIIVTLLGLILSLYLNITYSNTYIKVFICRAATLICTSYFTFIKFLMKSNYEVFDFCYFYVIFYALILLNLYILALINNRFTFSKVILQYGFHTLIICLCYFYFDNTYFFTLVSHSCVISTYYASDRVYTYDSAKNYSKRLMESLKLRFPLLCDRSTMDLFDYNKLSRFDKGFFNDKMAWLIENEIRICKDGLKTYNKDIAGTRNVERFLMEIHDSHIKKNKKKIFFFYYLFYYDITNIKIII